jgi:hypothetical protein
MSTGWSCRVSATEAAGEDVHAVIEELKTNRKTKLNARAWRRLRG